MKTAILSTGSELVNGTITDTNASWLAGQLKDGGVVTDKIIVIGDSLTQLAAVLKELWREYDLVICTGGLGPTTDDITAEAVSAALGVPLVRHGVAEAQIRARFAARSFAMAAVNLKQADLPTGCEVLENNAGTAPGFAVLTDTCKSFFLPGVPTEMKTMFDAHIRPEVVKNGTKVHSARFATFGIGESTLQERLLPLEGAWPDVTFSYRAAFPEMVTTVSGTSESSVMTVRQQVQQILSKWIYTTENKSMAHVVGEQLHAKRLTIATAESCTGGMICNEFTNVAGASDYVLGGVVAYNNRVKTEVLGVSDVVLQQYGAVSEEVVTSMATGVKDRLGADLAIATSGIAGPSGGTPEKPVGTVHIAVAAGNAIFHKKCLFKGYSRTKVKTATTWTALQMVLRHLVEKK